MNQRALAAEFAGTFMLMSSVLGAAFYSFGAPAGAAGILGVAFSIGLTVMALAFSIGHISGGHFNPAVTLGLVAGGRVNANTALGYIIAQCLGALAACALFYVIGRAPPTFAANGYDSLSMLRSGILEMIIVSWGPAACAPFSAPFCPPPLCAKASGAETATRQRTSSAKPACATPRWQTLTTAWITCVLRLQA